MQISEHQLVARIHDTTESHMAMNRGT